jgi:hypothetical protein
MSFLFSLLFLPVIAIGLVMSTVELYQWLSNRPSLSRGKAGIIAFFFAGISGGLLSVPHVFTAAAGTFTYVVAGVTALFMGTGLWFIWKWSRLIWASEDNDPSNDPTIGGTKGGCGCPKKDGTGNGDATKGDTTPKK